VGVGPSFRVLRVLHGVDHVVLVVELVQVELQVGLGVEGDHAYLDIVGTHVETVGHVLDEAEGLLEVGVAHGTGRVHDEQDVGWLDTAT